VRQHVADRHGTIELVVVEPDGGHEPLDRFVPPEPALVDEQAQSNGREELRVGRDRLRRRRGVRELVSVVAEAVSLSEHELVFHDDSHADAGRVPVLHHLRHVLVEAVEPGVHVDLRLGEDARGQHSGREEECGGKAATEPRGYDGHGDTSAFVSLPGSWETFDRDVAITLRVPRAIITTVRSPESAYSY